MVDLLHEQVIDGPGGPPGFVFMKITTGAFITTAGIEQKYETRLVAGDPGYTLQADSVRELDKDTVDLFELIGRNVRIGPPCAASPAAELTPGRRGR